MNPNILELPPLIPVSKFEELSGGIQSTSSLRWDIFKNRNGINQKCIVRRGRRLYVDTAAYFEWLRDHTEQLCETSYSGGVR